MAYANSHKKNLNKSSENIKKGENAFEMMKNNAQVTQNSAIAMLKLYSQGFRVNKTLEWKSKIKEFGFKFNKSCYAAVIKMYCYIRKMDQAFDIFYLMKHDNIPPNWSIYSNLIKGCTRSHKIVSGLNLLKEMKNNGYNIKFDNRFIVQFRRQLSNSPFIIKEIDDLTGKSQIFLPPWKKPGALKTRALSRDLTKAEKEDKYLQPQIQILPEYY